MPGISALNRLCERAFGCDKHQDPHVYFHACARSLDPVTGKEDRFFPQGSLRLRLDRAGIARRFPRLAKWLPCSVGFEWHLWSANCRAVADFSNDGEDSLLLAVALPPVSLYLSFDSLRAVTRFMDWACRSEKYSFNRRREISFRVFGWCVWWDLWMNPGTGSSTDPRWRRSRIDLKDLVLGRRRVTDVSEPAVDVMIPMPEGNYAAKLIMQRRITRRRFSRSAELFGQVDIEGGIPFEGKGENSWDCGEDAIFSLCRAGSTPEKIIAAVVETVLRERRKYSPGGLSAKYPPPAARLEAFRAHPIDPPERCCTTAGG